MAPRQDTDLSTPEPLLPVGYYLENFEAILEAVETRYRDLLEPTELAFIGDFAQLSLPSRRLYTRLLSRKGPYFRGDRLSYSEIPDIESSIEELHSGRFLVTPDNAETDKLLSLLLKAELLEFLERLGLAGSEMRRASKPVLFELVLREQPGNILRHTLIELFAMVELGRRDEILIFRLLFFGNLGQGWKEFVLRDTGVVRYESYPLAPAHDRRFGSRVEIEDAIVLRQARAALSELFYDREFERVCEIGLEIIAEHARWHVSCRPYLETIVYRTGRAHERLGERDQALEIFRLGRSSRCRRRRLRLFELTGHPREALDLCSEMAAENRDELELAAARSTAARLGAPLESIPRREIPLRSIEICRDPGVPVEQKVLDQLAKHKGDSKGGGVTGFFTENWLWCSLFGLAFWDIVFTPVCGVFQHEFQFGPLDLHLPDFRSARAELIDQRLAELHSLTCGRDLRSELMGTYVRKEGLANRLVSWSPALRPAIEMALELLGGKRLAMVCDRMSRDIKRYRRGFPDLFVTCLEHPGFELFEVKAPGDQLRPEQKAWIRYLNEADIPTSLLRVTWTGSD